MAAAAEAGPISTFAAHGPATQAEVLHERTEVLLDEWRDFVRECEAGDGWNVYEYHNDLAVRDRLQERGDPRAADLTLDGQT